MLKKQLFKFLTGILTALLITVCGSNSLAQSNKLVLPEYSKTISMEFKNADLNDVLRIFSQQSGLNFIASQDVSNKKVTLYLSNVPVEEALERILLANDLTYEIQAGSGIFIVKTLNKPLKELMTRIYRLKNATVSSSKLNKTISISAGDSSASSSSSGGEESASGSGGSSGGSGGSSGSEGIVSALKAVLTSDGKIVEDPRTNSLIITDIPTQFATIERTLGRLDVPVPQILIEVEMLDVSKDTADLLGLKFGNKPLEFTGGIRHFLYPFNQERAVDKGEFSFDQDENPEFEVGTLNASGLSVALQFLKTQTDTRNLARPRILTLNNETAQIKISTNEAIGITTQTQSAEGSATQSVEAERVETGVFLTVTPQANLVTGEITIAIFPKVIEARTGATFDGTTFKDPEERGSQSIMKVYSGDTIILGGLLRTDNSNTVTKVPILGDIPLVGGAFRHKDKSGTERELIIFITPHIINDENKIPPKLTTKNPLTLQREQAIPPKRENAIDRAMSTIEKQGL